MSLELGQRFEFQGLVSDVMFGFEGGWLAWRGDAQSGPDPSVDHAWLSPLCSFGLGLRIRDGLVAAIAMRGGYQLHPLRGRGVSEMQAPAQGRVLLSDDGFWWAPRLMLELRAW